MGPGDQSDTPRHADLLEDTFAVRARLDADLSRAGTRRALGYAEPVVDDAIRGQLHDGITFSLPHPLEVEVAERIVSLCPGVEMVRFGKSGSDAVSAAVRAARAITRRDRVVATGYHGWHDWFIGSTTRAAGVPRAICDLTTAVPFGDPHAVEAALALGDVAAIVVEPSGAEIPPPGYLQWLIDTAHLHGTLAVFDEVITGFRLAPGGARQRYGVQPDLSCYGKALGNGMPISAVGGTANTMKVFEEIFYSGTHGGETLSLAAARAVLDTIADGRVLAAIHDLGCRLQQGLQNLVARYGVEAIVRISGEPERTIVSFPGADELIHKSLVQQFLIERGVLFNGSMFISQRHTVLDIGHTLDAFADAFAALSSDADPRALLTGPPVEAVFRRP
ncbi:MAG: aminotransferase class III-fold pyridoxal phosphate-dependent enzyme [Actinobacteria bacterium]|nr:MAG: aminotransferase class III-fold pyridoxal phosphate-dependent enzyme [Actinomycetota bacterium]